MARILAATEPAYIDPPTDHSDGTPHRPWCSHHVDWRSTCHRPVPPVAGHAIFLTAEPGQDVVINLVPADVDNGVAQLTRAQLAEVLAAVDTALGGDR